MEVLGSLLTIIFLVSCIVAIVFGVKWFKVRKDKENILFKKNKKRFLITLVVFGISFIGAGIVENRVSEAEEEADIAKQESQYKDDKKSFIAGYKIVGYLVEDLSSKEGDEWNDAIENSDGDFDVESAVDTIQSNHSDDIDSVETHIEKLHELDQKIQKNDSVDDSDKEKIHNAYLDLKHFANHATNISGSYNQFTSDHNKLDQKTTDHVEELEDL